jgi:ABC-type polysaccharide/polyol phosphate transport system ATPase subunit
MASISVENISVVFPIYDGASRSLRHHIMTASTGGRIGPESRRISVEALSGVSFSLAHGDRVGLIGHNGAGKTTLLRVLAGIYEPVVGRVHVEGQVAPLFDAALGIDPDSTGYENIRLRGLYLGLTRREIESKMDEIAEFTELGPFLNVPLRTYSAGMQTRVAFAVSTSIDPEILLLDEAIGAGDAAFMAKAQRRMADLVSKAGILVFASHSTELVRRFCNKGIVLEHGRMIFMGSIDDALDFYADPHRHAVERASCPSH